MKERAILLIAILCAVYYFLARSTVPTDSSKGETFNLNGFLPDEVNNIEVYNKNAPSVVNVTCLTVSQTIYGSIDEPSGGSGFVWDNEGHIVTNYHVVANSNKIYVSMQGDTTQYEAKIVGSAPRQDMAVLKIIAPKDKIKPIEVGKSANLLVGQKTLALGNPYGLDHTLTIGIISALERKIQSYGDVEIHGIIQTDASINPGNSGGPLLDSKGLLIGMNTAILSKSGSSAGVGFAVPVDTIKNIIPQLIKYGKEIRPTLGVILEPRIRLNKGIAIRSVIHDPALSAGLKGLSRDMYGRLYFGDIIISIDNYEINSINDLYHCMGKYKIDDTVELRYLRDGKLYSIKIKLSPN